MRNSLIAVAVLAAAAIAFLCLSADSTAPEGGGIGTEPLGALHSGTEHAATSDQARVRAAKEPRYAYHAETGTELVFAWKGRSRMAMGKDDAPASAGPSFDMQGQLVVAIRSREERALVAELRCAKAEVTPAVSVGAVALSKVAADLRRDLESGVLVRMAESGEVLGYRFAEGTTLEGKNWWRTLVSTARVMLASDASEQWTTEETDAAGKVRVEHAWTAPEAGHRRAFTGKRVGYVDATERSPRPTLHSELRGVFDAELGWVREIESRETAHVKMPLAGVRVDTQAEFTFRLADVRGAAVSAQRFEPAEAALSGMADARAAASQANEHDWRMTLQGVPTADLIAALAELCKGELSSSELLAARERLVQALKLWPERVTDVLAAVRSGTLTDRATMVVLAALGAAKHETAQKALAECAGPEQKETLRVFALRSLFQVDAPCASALAVALAGSRDQGSRIVANTALLLTGSFAGQDARAIEALLGLEAHAAANGELETWLEAVGNAGVQQALPAVARHLAAADPEIRARALNALREMPGDAALNAIADRASTDPDARVRGRAAGLLGAREDGRGLAIVDRLLTQEQDERVRIAALRGLLPRMPDSQAQRLFERAVEQDGAKAVREFAAGVLKGS